MFHSVDHSPDFGELEHKILELWQRTGAFDLRRELSKGKRPWSFLDGPITANNPMGVHHAWGRTYKDFFRRFYAMNDFDPSYQNGFDCQGLWVEVEVEKELGFKSKRDIEAFGIAEFVKRCKQRALRFAAIQTEQSIRLGYWMQWDDPDTLRRLADGLNDPTKVMLYKGPSGASMQATPERIIGSLGSLELGGSYYTLSDENNYAIWAVLKVCDERGWIRKGKDVMPWCPRCSTALSEHEISTEGYREIVHSSLTVRFPLKGREREALLVWTTTPWTLTSNVAVAVNPTMSYVKVRTGRDILYLAKSAVSRLFDGKVEVLEELSGGDLEGLAYEGPFDDLQAVKQAGAEEHHRVILWEDVGEDEGTGLVHIAPGCGKEDFELGKQLGLPAISPLEEYGIFVDGFGQFTGKHVYESAKQVVSELESRGLVFKVEQYSHRYPVCWRCQSELVHRLVSEWFISMGDKTDESHKMDFGGTEAKSLRSQIIDNCKQVKWIPAFGLLQESDWLQNMDDWMISKKRYWGLALPIWECRNCGSFVVIGSKEELKSRAKAGWSEFDGHSPHRPWIDAIKIECPKCGKLTSRIPDVGNPWLDAGIVAYSTLGYFSNHEFWVKWFPSELICESLSGQFRNWFYALLTMSAILENRPPSRVIFGHGSVLAEDGRQMHKSWGNAIWFDQAVESMGADVMRWMYLSNKPESNMRFGLDYADQVKRSLLLPLWNIYSFFVTYANLDQWRPNGSNVEYSHLDRWIASRLQILIQDVTDAIRRFDAQLATSELSGFVDDLSKWYVRRSRRRFWKTENGRDKEAAYVTLYDCLTTLARLLAPFIPFFSEEIYQNLVRSYDSTAPISVHLTSWPTSNRTLIDRDTVSAMELAMAVSRLGHAAREAAGIKVRQPLERAFVVGDSANLDLLNQVRDLIVDELNVKQLSFPLEREELLDYRVRPLPEVLGVKYGRLFPKILRSLETADQSLVARSLQQGQHLTLEVDGNVVTLGPKDVEVLTRGKIGLSLVEEGGLTVAVDITINENLRAEGLVRDIIRRIQNQRKEAGFRIDDLIETYYRAGSAVAKVIEDHKKFISEETLSKVLVLAAPPSNAYVRTYQIGEEKLELGLVR